MTYKNDDIVIVEPKRTAIGSFNGTLSSLEAHELGSEVIQHILKETNITAEDVDEVILPPYPTPRFQNFRRPF